MFYGADMLSKKSFSNQERRIQTSVHVIRAETELKHVNQFYSGRLPAFLLLIF